MTPSIIHHLDIRGGMAPISTLKAIRAFRETRTGGILEIRGDDWSVWEDLSRALKTFHYQWMVVEKKKTFYRVQLKKTKGESDT